MSGTSERVRRADVPTRITPATWAAARASLAQACERFCALVAGADPRAMATADWTVMDAAAHVTVIARMYTARVVSDDSPMPLPGQDEHFLATTVDNIHAGLNAHALEGYTERDPDAVLGLLRSSVAEVLTLTEGEGPARTVGWLGGSRLPLAGCIAHLTNELLVHGRDIARGVRAPWVIPAPDAARFFELFVIEIIRNGVGVLLDDSRPVRPGRIAVEFRSAYTVPVTIVTDTGQLWCEEPARDNDARVFFDPAGLDLMLFHRISRPRAALTGAVRIRGRRPWLLAPFLRKVRLP